MRRKRPLFLKYLSFRATFSVVFFVHSKKKRIFAVLIWGIHNKDYSVVNIKESQSYFLIVAVLFFNDTARNTFLTCNTLTWDHVLTQRRGSRKWGQRIFPVGRCRLIKNKVWRVCTCSQEDRPPVRWQHKRILWAIRKNMEDESEIDSPELIDDDDIEYTQSCI